MTKAEAVCLSHSGLATLRQYHRFVLAQPLCVKRPILYIAHTSHIRDVIASVNRNWGRQ